MTQKRKREGHRRTESSFLRRLSISMKNAGEDCNYVPAIAEDGLRCFERLVIEADTSDVPHIDIVRRVADWYSCVITFADGTEVKHISIIQEELVGVLRKYFDDAFLP